MPFTSGPESRSVGKAEQVSTSRLRDLAALSSQILEDYSITPENPSLPDSLSSSTSEIPKRNDVDSHTMSEVDSDDNSDNSDDHLEALVNDYRRVCQENQQLVERVNGLQSMNAELALFSQKLLLQLSQLQNAPAQALPPSLVNTNIFDQHQQQATNFHISPEYSIPTVPEDDIDNEGNSSALYNPDEIFTDSYPSTIQKSPLVSSNSTFTIQNPIFSSSETTAVSNLLIQSPITAESVDFTTKAFAPLLKTLPAFNQKCPCCVSMERSLRAIPSLAHPDSLARIPANIPSISSFSSFSGQPPSFEQELSLFTDLRNTNGGFDALTAMGEDVNVSVSALDVSTLDNASRFVSPGVYSNRSQVRLGGADIVDTAVGSTTNKIPAVNEMRKVWEEAEKEFASRFLAAYYDKTSYHDSDIEPLDDELTRRQANSSIGKSSPSPQLPMVNTLLSPSSSSPILVGTPKTCSSCHNIILHHERNNSMCDLETDSDRSLKHSTLRFALWVVVMSALAFDMLTRVRTSTVEFYPM